MLKTLANTVKTAWHAAVTFVTLKDRVAKVEIEKRYGTLGWAQRTPQTQHDLDAPKVNANVYIATRAISDAIKGLKVDIKVVEMVKGVEREVDDNDHPANALIHNPNPEHSWTDVVDHIIKSYLTDGNAILTIERMTGPNERVELWPRDPRCVDINTVTRDYRFGKYTASQRVYPRNRVLHIRDMSVDDPFWGTGRISTVREEILMDYFVNRFNSNFFKHGATLNLMFTPDHDLTEDQHTQLLDAMNADLEGAEKAFKLFVNRFAGKLEYPDQKHKDIAFLALLKHCREKIFGVFGLPPFRGGVMEYANYANALAQDKDFWLNTVKPILTVIEDAIAVQVLWPLYGTDTRMRFDLSDVPAIKGDQTQVEDRLLKLKKEGIVSAAYVREQLDIDESAAPEIPDALKPTTAPQDDPDENEPTDAEEQEVENAIFRALRLQRVGMLYNLARLTSDGSLMSVLCDPKSQAAKIYNPIVANRALRNALQPVMRSIAVRRTTAAINGAGVCDPQHPAIESLNRQVAFKIEDAVEQNTLLLSMLLDNADKFGWSYQQLTTNIRRTFSHDRACGMTEAMLPAFIKGTADTIATIKNERFAANIQIGV